MKEAGQDHGRLASLPYWLLRPERHIVSRTPGLAQAGCGRVLLCALEVAVHSLTQTEPCFLLSAIDIVWEKHRFLGQHEDYPVEGPANINCYY